MSIREAADQKDRVKVKEDGKVYGEYPDTASCSLPWLGCHGPSGGFLAVKSRSPLPTNKHNEKY